ncbi:MAG: urease accessory protein UreD [Pseudorhodoplanes sp.]
MLMQATATYDRATIFAANRARGRIDVSVAQSAGRTRRRRVLEDGSYRIRFPNVSGEEAEAVIVNSAGGVAGGDQFEVAIEVKEGARLAVLTAAAEKVYRAIGTASQMDVRLRVEAEGALRWLPQETILFDEARLHRSITVDLDEAATLMMAEVVIFGRAAMDETMKQGELIDRWRIRRGGRLVLAETLRLRGEVENLLARPACGQGAVALATAIFAPGDDNLCARVREALQGCGAEAAISAWNGIAVARLCASDAALLRRDLISVLNAAGGALPRLWTN